MDGWPGGWRPDLADSAIDETMLHDVSDIEWTNGYGLKKRGGYEQICDNAATMGDGQYVWALGTWKVIGSSTLVDPGQVVVFADEAAANLWYQTSNKLLDTPNTDMVDSTLDMGSVKGVASNLNPVDEYQLNAFVFNDIIYITGHRFGGSDNGVYTNSTEDGTASGTTKAASFDIEAGTWARQAVPDFTAAVNQTGIPRAVSSLVLHDRVFYANVVSQNSYDFGQRIYWSDAGTADAFAYTDGAFGFLTVGADDGTTIRKMIGLSGEIIVFKEESVWTLTGTDEDTFNLHLLSDQYGCHAANSAVVHKERVIWFDHYAGVVSYDGARFETLSDPINDHLFSRVDRSVLHKVVGFMDDTKERYYLSVPGTSAGDDTNDLTYVYDFRLNTWTVWQYGFSAAIKINSTVNVADPVALDGPIWTTGTCPHQSSILPGIFKINSGDNDNGNPISCNFDTAWINPGDVGDRHRLRRWDLLIDAAPGTAEALNGYLYRDFNRTGVWITSAAFTPDTDIEEYHEQQQEAVGTAPTASADVEHGGFTWLRFYFVSGSNDQFWQVNGLAISYSTRPFNRAHLAGLNRIAPGGE